MTPKPSTVDDPPDFAAWLTAHARGTLNDELTMALAEVVESVAHLDKKGALTLTITVEPAGSGGRTIAITGKTSAKPPVPNPEVGIFYVGDGGSLHRDDPFAGRLPGVPYRDTAGDVKVVDASGEIRRLDTDRPEEG